jgi:hypothetical protein
VWPAFLAGWLWCVFLARDIIRSLAVDAGITRIPIILYIIGGLLISVPLLVAFGWFLKLVYPDINLSGDNSQTSSKRIYTSNQGDAYQPASPHPREAHTFIEPAFSAQDRTSPPAAEPAPASPRCMNPTCGRLLVRGARECPHCGTPYRC